MKQRRTAAVQTGSFSGDAHILAWTPKGDDVHRRQLCTMQSADIAEVLYLRQPFSVTRMANGSISEDQTGTMPASSPASGKPPLPSKRLPRVRLRI